MDWSEHRTTLESKKNKIREMGGEEAIAKQKKLGKMTARERIAYLLDENSFVEMGILVHDHSEHPSMRDKETPADGVITGHGTIDGRRVCVAAYDYTVMAGSMGESGEVKVKRVREWALKNRVPMIWLIDSAGARIHEAIGSWFARTGDLFFEEVIMSGVIPQVCAMMGPGAAGTAYIPALADFVPMVKDTSFMALGGPPLVKAVVGEEIDENSLGGSKVHTEVSGVADMEVPDDKSCLDSVKDYLSYFPSNNQAKSIKKETLDPEDRYVEEVFDIVPTSPRATYDVTKLIRAIVDDGEIFEMKQKWARNIVTAFARMGGKSVGIVANQPMFKGGILDVDSADKAARFINLCDAFNIPLIFLTDVPGFMIGSVVEKQGIIRHGAKMLYAVSEATVPKFTVVTRKAYGAGYYVMNGKAFEPDLIVAWPTAEISVMGPEGAVNIIFRKEISKAEDPKAAREEKVAEFREKINPEIAASFGLIDDIIDPGNTRKVLIQALKLTQEKTISRPWKKHGVMPV